MALIGAGTDRENLVTSIGSCESRVSILDGCLRQGGCVRADCGVARVQPDACWSAHANWIHTPRKDCKDDNGNLNMCEAGHDHAAERREVNQDQQQGDIGPGRMIRVSNDPVGQHKERQRQ
jgi:hypothetical protein